jgi:ParB family transcriptional regulator, chromosome partitioning protein
MPRGIRAQPVEPADEPELPVGSTEHDGIRHIRMDDIVFSPRNPRRSLDDIDELAASIREYGLLQPVVVRKKGKKYELVAGHRRFAALRSIDWSEVPAVVREDSAERAYLLTLIENLQRDDLSPREEADALAELVRTRKWSTRQVADVIKRSQAFVSKRLRVFDDPLLRPALLENRLSVSAAEELLALGAERRQAVLEEALASEWDQAAVRAAVRRELGQAARPRRNPKLRTQVENLRTLLRGIHPAELAEVDRSALRRLFADLAMLARAPKVRRAPVFPALPEVPASTRRRRA